MSLFGLDSPQDAGAQSLRDVLTYQLFEGSRVPKVLVGEDRLIYAANEAYARLLGYTPSELYLTRADRLTLEEDRERFRPDHERFWSGESPTLSLRKRYVRKSGDVIWVDVGASEIADVGGRRYALSEVQDVTAEIEASTSLRMQEERLRLLLEGTDDGLWDWTISTGAVFFSPGLCRMLGYDVHEFAPSLRSWADRVHEDDWTMVMEALEPHLEGRIPLYMMEYRLRHRDGHYIWVLARGSVVKRDEEGRALRMIGTMVDVTARHVAEDALRDSERFNHVLLDSSMDCVKLLDLDGRVEYMNSAGLLALGLDNFTAIAGDVWTEFWEDALRPLAQRAIDAARRGGTGRFEGSCPSRTGVVKWWDVTLTPVRNARGDITRLLCVSRDITAAWRAAEQLKESEARFRRIAERAPVGLFLDDAHCNGVYVNPRLAAMFGGTPDELLSGLWREALHPEDAARVLEERRQFTNSDADSARIDHRFIRRDGAVRSAQLEYVRLRASDGTTEGFAGLVEDVTDRVAMERQIRQKQKLEAVGQLAGGIAHDFNNLLTVIGTYGEFLRDEPSLSPMGRADLNELLGAAKRAGALTRQLLAFSRRQMMQPRVIGPNDVVRGIDAMLRRALGATVTLVIDLRAKTCAVRADPGQLEQVLMNLALNARDAMPGGGLLTIETDCAELTCEDIRQFAATSVAPVLNERPGKYVVIRVSDQGVGMDADTQRQMFEPFFTTKPAGQGTGLGLATVYGIVAQSDGYIRVRSAPGDGTSIEVYLPTQAKESAQEAELLELSVPVHQGGSETILVVEDEMAVRRSLQRLLSGAGYTVLEARHGADGLRLWREHRERIALVMTDLVMPEMGGAELAGDITNEAPEDADPVHFRLRLAAGARFTACRCVGGGEAVLGPGAAACRAIGTRRRPARVLAGAAGATIEAADAEAAPLATTV